MLANHLASRGVRVLFTAEPSDGPVGVFIKSLKIRAQPEEEARLFTEDRRDHLRRTIVPALEKGITVICDRYVYSSAAYQGARGIDRSLFWQKIGRLHCKRTSRFSSK